jgi:hypothetical protein
MLTNISTDRQPQGRDEGLCDHWARREGGCGALAPYCQQLGCRDVRGFRGAMGFYQAVFEGRLIR